MVLLDYKTIAFCHLESKHDTETYRERSFGDLEGKPFEAMLEAIKGLNKEQKHTWGPPNGETGVMFRERIGR